LTRYLTTRRKISHLFVQCAAIALMLTPASAATFYVATNGSDSNPGSSTQPFLTVQKGVNVAIAGDTIIVRDGTYGPNGTNSGSMPVNVYSAGTPSAPITLKAEHRWGAVLNCALTCHSYVNFGGGSAYWILQDFDITGGLSAGVWENSTTHDILVKGNHIHNIGNISTTTTYGIVGAYSGSSASNLTFDGNVINDIGRTNTYYVNHDQGLYIQGSVNTKIINNVFYDMFRGWGVQLSTGPNTVLIANNTFAFANPYRDGQIVFDGNVSNVTIRNNIFYQTTGLAVSNAGGTASGCTIDTNIIYGASSVTDSTCSSSNNRFVNPLLQNASAAPYDFHLASGSPAVDTGAVVPAVTTDFDGTARPAGAGYDVGAFEFAGAQSTTVAAPAPAPQPSTSTAFAPIRINAGGPGFTDTLGQFWNPDNGFTGGSTYSTGNAIAGTTNAALYQSERYSTSTLEYRFAVPNGSYNVNLKFAEIYLSGFGQRVFNIVINGQVVEPLFDPAVAAGGPNIAVDRLYPVSVTTGLIDIQLVPVISNPKISAIEIVAGSGQTSSAVSPTTSTFTAIRVNSGGSAYTDPTGTVWNSDNGYTSGNGYSSWSFISGTTTPVLYQSERWSSSVLEYRFTIPNGTYSVKLKFAEIYFSGVGQRVFNIVINGQLLTSAFDTVAAAGGPNIAVDRLYTVAVTNGQIDIQLVPIIQNPKISAIEILQP
jgi:hypothetical protein